MSQKAGVVRCSFCDKDSETAKKVITGERANICDECIDMCNDILAEESPYKTEEELEVIPGDPRFFCSFCGGKHVGRFPLTAASGNASICETCILQHFQWLEVFRGPWKRSFFTGVLRIPLEPQSSKRVVVVAVGILVGASMLAWRIFVGPFGITL